MKKTASFSLLLVLICNSAVLMAQTETESVVSENDKFQDLFYEALLQKGIENYDKAIVTLEACSTLKPNDAAVYSELGKNYLAQKDYEHAYNSFEKASQIDPQNKWLWAGMYEANYQTKNYNQAIITINKLIAFDEQYKEDLISLYMNTQQFDKALILIYELNEKMGKSDRRELYKTQIMAQGNYQNATITTLLAQINSDPKVESNYLALIKLYRENHEPKKAIEIAKKLQTEIPNSAWAQVGLFQSYTDKKDGIKAINAMTIVLENTAIDPETKNNILKNFLLFVRSNPQYTTAVAPAIALLNQDLEAKTAEEIGKYYYNQKQWSKAIQYYELSVKNAEATAIETHLQLLQLYVETQQFEIVSKKAASLLEVFPAEPKFYYYAGWANNQLLQFKNAITILELGLDYVIDNLLLEANFNLQLGEAYNGVGNFKKKEACFAKATLLLKEKK